MIGSPLGWMMASPPNISNPSARRRVQRRLAQARRLEGMAQHSFVTMIEPLEPIGIRSRRAVSDAVEFDEIARHMLLGDDKGNAALGEPAQRLAPSGLRCRVHDIIGLRRVEIVAFDPRAVRRSRLARVGGDDPADGRRDAVSREELDHAVAVGVANRGRRIDDDRARLLRRREAIEDRPALAHHEHVG